MFIEILQESDKCTPWISKVKHIFENMKTIRDAPPKELFATVTHRDTWINNTMVKFENGVPVSNKLLDFQLCDYKSPPTDLFFFLFVSVQLPVLRNNLDGLIEFYHKHFISNLEKLKCETAPFSLPKFLEEMKAATPVEALHCMGMTSFVVLGEKGGPSTEYDLSVPSNFEKMKTNISTAAKEKIWYLTKVCGTKGWLD
ncbi:uncharacterized protein LOC108909860 [Anoplophora glabripennis]|uniref:uncharacterized protein LOC108909860 n=1 Tax=Anoplophora glabripennis TaxID=217634 RepID=UPI000873C1C1|nr:uncharacterized protein LOC108909860 [Anoplophora glabripennis]